MSKFIVKCAWCGKIMREEIRNDNNLENIISHGLCEKCMKKEIEKMKKEIKIEKEEVEKWMGKKN